MRVNIKHETNQPLGDLNMKLMDLQETADYLEEAATIDFSIDTGHAIIHTGKNIAGVGFVLVNNYIGDTVLTESM